MKRGESRRIGPVFQPISGLLILLVIVSVSFATMPSAHAESGQPDWSEGVPIPEGGRPNPYQLDAGDYRDAVGAGKLHAQLYPVEITGALPPWEPMKRVLDGPANNPLSDFIREVFRRLIGVRGTDDVFAWLGLHPYPSVSDTGVYAVPYPEGRRPDFRMGFGLIPNADGMGFSFSCATCHSANLFGKTVLGLTNRFPRANEYFIYSRLGLSLVSEEAFRVGTGASEGEVRMLRALKDNLRFVGAKSPQVLGLDTSLAQVALSMARRGRDPYAIRDPELAAHPRPEPLAQLVADSKPAVWWDLKYKDRWLSDGSVVSGNPIYTNLLWNEIGRGTDLVKLEGWLNGNSQKIKELTSAVFSAEAPRFTDFFPAGRIDLDRARRGERIFIQRCANCHGTYEKAWDLPGSEAFIPEQRLATVRVRYPERTRVMDVGTDPGRYEGMASLARALNPLAISRNERIVIKPQKGYVPPPLVGIWARWPYFHNNSVPSLCAVLTRHEDRPATYFAGEADDPDRDFDSECNGYPSGSAVPESWKTNYSAFYDTSREGMHNTGHDERIFLKNGVELLTPEDKRDLIQFLQTL